MTDEELLDLSDIANLYRVSRRYARDVLVKSPGFPMPVLAISQKTRRWSVADVRRWLCERRAMGSR